MPVFYFDVTRNTTRRKMLYKTGTIILATSLGSGSAIASNQYDFDPHELDEVERVVDKLDEQNQKNRDKAIKKFNKKQRKAIEDALKPLYKTHKRKRKIRNKTIGRRSEAEYTVIKHKNTHIPNKWGWDIDIPDERSPSDVKPPNNGISEIDTSSNDTSDITTSSSGDYNGTSEYQDEVSESGVLRELYSWGHWIKWDWSYLRTPYGYTEKHTENGVNDFSILNTGTGWGFGSVVTKNDFHDDTEYGHDYVSIIELMFETISGDDAYPRLVLKGSYLGNGSTDTSRSK